MPGSVKGPNSGSAIGNAARRDGTPLADVGNADTSEPRVYRGSSAFTTDAGAAGGPRRAGSERGVAVSGDGITLNLVDVSIPEVAKTILGDTLRLNYSVSPAVNGSISLSTVTPIRRQDLLGVFETLLRTEGAVIVVENGLHKIIPGNAASTGVQVPRMLTAQGGGLSTQIVPLRYIAAEEMERILKPLAPQSSIALVDANRNLILVRGTASELASIRETVVTFDVDWMRGMSVGIFPVDTSDPEAIAQELDTIFGNDKSGPIKGVVRFVPNRRLKSVLVITSRSEYLAKAESWIRRIDLVGRDSEKQVHVYHVQSRPATELGKLLQQVYKSPSDDQGQAGSSLAATSAETPAGDFAPVGAGATPTALEPKPLSSVLPFPLVPAQTPGSAPPTPAQAPGSLTTATVASAASARAAGRPDDRSNGIQIIADDANNSLIITATTAEYRRLRQILSRLDVAPNQVLLEATIAEITLNDQLRFGLRWFFQRKANQLTLTDSVIGTVAPQFPGFSYFFNLPNVQVALNALSDVTDVNIVSSPSLMVLDNKLAVLQIGDEVPIATQSAVSVVTPGAPIVNSVAFRSTGVILRIRPRIGDNGRVLLEIEQEVSDVVPTTTSTIDSPTIQQRRIKTVVAVGTGNSIVLAGFMQDRASNRRQKVPLIGSLPVLGNLFKDKDDQIRRTELLIAITPNIVKDPSQISGISAEFRDRLNFTTRPQRRAPPDRREQIDRVIVR